MVADSLAVQLPFVGRVDELAALHRLLRGAMSGSPRLVLVTGDPGIGKSRLVAELAAAARDDGAQVLTGSCHEGVAIPYLPVATALRPLGHPGTERLSPSTHLDGARSGAETDDVRLDIFMGATAALVDAAGARPVLLVLEDVQWADEASAELMRHLLLASLHETAASDRPLLVVVTARERWPAGAPAALARLPREEAAIELHLEPFGALEAHAMVHALTGARPRTEVTRRITIGDMTGGW
jgi:predicted ATPase